MRYPVDLTQDGDSITATLPGLPGGTFGETEDEALEHAEDLLATIVAHALADGRELPEPPAADGRPTVMLRADIAIKVALHEAFRDSGLTKSELAGRLGWQHPQVNRLFDPHHHSRIDQVVKALRALGKRLDIHVEDPRPVRSKAKGRGPHGRAA